MLNIELAARMKNKGYWECYIWASSIYCVEFIRQYHRLDILAYSDYVYISKIKNSLWQFQIFSVYSIIERKTLICLLFNSVFFVKFVINIAFLFNIKWIILIFCFLSVCLVITHLIITLMKIYTMRLRDCANDKLSNFFSHCLYICMVRYILKRLADIYENWYTVRTRESANYFFTFI